MSAQVSCAGLHTYRSYCMPIDYFIWDAGDMMNLNKFKADRSLYMKRRAKIKPNKVKILKTKWEGHTGAMYSSVPTNEFDFATGSAINIGGGWLVDLLRFGRGSFLTCTTVPNITCTETRQWLIILLN